MLRHQVSDLNIRALRRGSQCTPKSCCHVALAAVKAAAGVGVVPAVVDSAVTCLAISRHLDVRWLPELTFISAAFVSRLGVRWLLGASIS